MFHLCTSVLSSVSVCLFRCTSVSVSDPTSSRSLQVSRVFDVLRPFLRGDLEGLPRAGTVVELKSEAWTLLL